mmetsp:Transcript_32960/g.95440  ORF Transcript_32960/g.95440 Transcript_32960/m.95440 type:complete len:277 (-) Transcript_32960:100-930(-)
MPRHVELGHHADAPRGGIGHNLFDIARGVHCGGVPGSRSGEVRHGRGLKGERVRIHNVPVKHIEFHNRHRIQERLQLRHREEVVRSVQQQSPPGVPWSVINGQRSVADDHARPPRHALDELRESGQPVKGPKDRLRRQHCTARRRRHLEVIALVHIKLRCSSIVLLLYHNHELPQLEHCGVSHGCITSAAVVVVVTGECELGLREASLTPLRLLEYLLQSSLSCCLKASRASPALYGNREAGQDLNMNRATGRVCRRWPHRHRACAGPACSISACE